MDEFEYNNVGWNTDPLGMPPGSDQNIQGEVLPSAPGPSVSQTSPSAPVPQVATKILNVATETAIIAPESNTIIASSPASTNHPAELIDRSVIQIEVCNPEKHGEGLKDAYTSYETTMEAYKEKKISVRRRYGDFVWLYNQLQDHFPTCILPPLPEKQRLEYLDRFSTEFIERRMNSLQRFVDHLTVHPILFRSEQLKCFLEKEYLSTEYKRKDSSMFENISDVLMNAFSKVKKPEERFINFSLNMAKFETHLKSIEKSQHGMIKHFSDLNDENREFVNSYSNLAHLEPGLFEALMRLVKVHETLSSMGKTFIDQLDINCQGTIKDYLQYCRNARIIKITLKTRDQRQLDFEDLTGFLKDHIAERDKIIRTGDANAASNAISHFIQKKMDEFKGVDPVKAKQVKLEKLESKIAELQKAVESSNETSIAFNNETIKEFQIFDCMKNEDFDGFIRKYSDLHLQYHKGALKEWEELLPMLE